MHKFLTACLCLFLMTLTSDNAAAEANIWKVFNISESDRLNVRSGPSTRHLIKHKLPFGQGNLQKDICVVPVDTNSVWCEISEGEGPIGWVNARFLTLDNQAISDTQKEGLILAGGFRSTEDPCKIAGESELTAEYLDDSAFLVACPKADTKYFKSEFKKAKVVFKTKSFVVFSVPGK